MRTIVYVTRRARTLAPVLALVGLLLLLANCNDAGAGGGLNLEGTWSGNQFAATQSGPVKIADLTITVEDDSGGTVTGSIQADGTDAQYDFEGDFTGSRSGSAFELTATSSQTGTTIEVTGTAGGDAVGDSADGTWSIVGESADGTFSVTKQN